MNVFKLVDQYDFTITDRQIPVTKDKMVTPSESSFDFPKQDWFTSVDELQPFVIELART